MSLCVAGDVRGVTQFRDVVYVISRGSSVVRRFSAATHLRLADVVVKGLTDPWDVAACERTSRLYVADDNERVWRLSSDGRDVKRWLQTSESDVFRPWSLSVTSTRLLVTSKYDRQLRQFDAGGSEVGRVRLPDYMRCHHAVESPSTAFVVSHENTELKQWQVSEVDTDGRVLRQFSGARLPSPNNPPHLAVDSRGNVFVADVDGCRILLLDAQLALRRVVIDKHQLNDREPWRLCYTEHSGQLLVGLYRSLELYHVLRR